jgi:hypothetical protein
MRKINDRITGKSRMLSEIKTDVKCQIHTQQINQFLGGQKYHLAIKYLFFYNNLHAL